MRDQVDKIIKRIHDLPTLPLVYKRVSDLLRNPYTSASDVAVVISEDQVITTKLLRLVNSAHYGFPEKVETITRAVSLVGMQQVKDLVLATTVMDLFHDHQLENWTTAEFWRHSLGVAVISSSLAKQLGMEAQAEEFFVAGLIHDIGKVVWMEHFHLELFEVLAVAHSQRLTMYEAEQQRLNFTHARAGRMLAKRWGLPDRMVETIAWHHEPRLAEKFPHYPAMVHVADCIANAMRFGSSGNGRVPELRSDALEICGLAAHHVPELLECVTGEYEDALLLLSFWDEDEKSEVKSELTNA